jgi:HSP20 family protein
MPPYEEDSRSRSTAKTDLDRPRGHRREERRHPIRDWFEAMDRLPFGFYAPPVGPFRHRRPSATNQSSQSLHSATWLPEIESFHRGDEFIVRADLPGMKREDISVEVQDDALVIEGERNSDFEDREEGYYTSERSYGHFCRVVPLPEGAIADSVKATFRDGVLEVVTKAPPPQDANRGRRIEVGER